jgi:sugar phosphate isomerase/epimerase
MREKRWRGLTTITWRMNNMTKQIFKFEHREGLVWIEPSVLGFRLVWTDGINDWDEVYSNLSVAVCRMGAVIKCFENKEDPSFEIQDPIEFAEKIKEVL